MSIGNHSFWIIAVPKNNLGDWQAVTVTGDARRAIRFERQADLFKYLDAHPEITDWHPVFVPA